MAKKKKIEGSLEKEKFLIELGIKFAKELTTKATPWELEFGKILITLGVGNIDSKSMWQKFTTSTTNNRR